ncbi:MAG TPA: putative toxin-antitoxin system toxin component, PIN family [Acidobacteriota bacterium]|jgi:hypothetical protein
MKVVVDTNVFVSSFFGGNPRKIIDLWKEGQLTLCLSPGILEEYVNVLQRMGLEEEELEEILALFARGWNSLFTAKTPKLEIVASDPGDDKFIECAVALNARVIISGDKALIDIGHYMGIKLVTPKKFLDEYSEQ